MKTYNLFEPSLSAAADRTSVGVDIGDLDTLAVEVDFPGTDLVGTLTLQCRTSVDRAWVTVVNSSQAVTLSADHVWNVTGAGYRWLRVFWDYTSGTGNIAGQMTVKERTVKEA